MPPPLFPSALVYVARLAIQHLALPFGLVVDPFTCVSVLIREGHGASAELVACGKVADVGVTGRVDHDAGAVGEGVDRGEGVVRAAKIAIQEVPGEIPRVVVGVKEVEVSDWAGVLRLR